MFCLCVFYLCRGKERISIALRNGKNVKFGHVQKSSQNLTVRCRVVWNDVDLGMVIVTPSMSLKTPGVGNEASSIALPVSRV